MDKPTRDEAIKVAAAKLRHAIQDAQDALSTYRQVLKNAEGDEQGERFALARRVHVGEAVDPKELVAVLLASDTAREKLAGANAVRDLLNSAAGHL